MLETTAIESEPVTMWTIGISDWESDDVKTELVTISEYLRQPL